MGAEELRRYCDGDVTESSSSDDEDDDDFYYCERARLNLHKCR